MRSRASGCNKAIGLAAAILIAVIVVAAIVAVVYVGFIRPTSASTTIGTQQSTTGTSSVPATSISTSPSSSSMTNQTASTSLASSTGPLNRSQLVVIENEPPNSVDPASGFFAGEDEVMVNVYQGLVMFNYTSLTEFAPILATGWSNNADYTSYSFTLRSNAYFMNGDPFNASVVWFNFYRTIVMNQIGASYFTNLLYNGTTAYATGYAVPEGVAAALESAGYQLSTTNNSLAQVQAAKDLANILSNFNAANVTQQKIMSYPSQAVVVTGPYSVEFNLVNPYIDFLQVLSVPGAGQVDPAFVDQNGGVAPNQANTYVNTHSMGTGPYTVKSYVQGQVLTMTENTNYWAARLPASQTNIMLTLPKIPVVILEYETSATQMIQGIESNSASLLEGPPIPTPAPTYLPTLASTPGIKVVSLPNAPKFLFLMATLDTEQYPYNITDFRLALAHAVNYSEILSSVAMGYGQQYVGPISPGLPYYNPGNLAPYNFDPAYSIRLLSGLGFKLVLPNGTVINPDGKTVQLSITYTNDDPAEVKIAQEMQIMFSDIGLQFALNGVTTQAEETAISQPGTASSYPGLLLWYWYPSWLDPVYQDLVVQSNVQYGGIGGDVSWFNNSVVNNLTANLPFQTSPAAINRSVIQIYNIIYQQAPDIWLYAVVPYWVQRTYLSGIIYNPGILGYYYPLMYYT
jgi:peptide/nickel transport system substrate-binding protein